MDIVNGVLRNIMLLAIAMMSPTVHSLQVMMGDASCDGAGSCFIDNLDPFSDNSIDNEVMRFELRDNQRIEVIPGSDPNGKFELTMYWGWINDGVTEVDLTKSFRFFDGNGDTVGPDIRTYTWTLQPGVGHGNLTTYGFADSSFVLSGLEVTWACPACAPDQIGIAAQPDYYIKIWNLDATSQVVPLPPAVWLFGSGLLGFVGIARRKKPIQ